MSRLLKAVVAWLCLNHVVVCATRVRRILPLDHHKRIDHSVRGLQAKFGTSVDGDSAEHKGGSAAAASATDYNSAETTTNNNARSGREKGAGFLGDGLNIIGGRKASGGGSAAYTSNEDNYASDSSPSSGYYDSYRSGVHTPTASSGNGHYSPTYTPLSYSSKSKGKSSSSSSGKKSKGKSKGKAKKGKKGKSTSSSSEDNEAARPIEASFGRDEIYQSEAVSASADESPPPAPDVTPPGRATIDLTPFGVLFDLADDVGTPSSESYGMAIEVTVGYLNTYMSLQYEGQGLEDFQTTATATIYRDGAPQIDFTATATFDGVTPPTQETLDNNVANAFSGANLALFLSMLQNLPESNVFRTVSGARLTNPANQNSSRSSLIGDVSTVGKAGIAGAIGAGGLIIFAIGFMVYGKQRKIPSRVRVESDRKPRKATQSAEQATLMGETTCSTSSDSDAWPSSRAAGRIPSSIRHGREPPIALEDVSLEPSLGR